MSAAVTEKQVQEIWLDVLQRGLELKTAADESFKIVYPGRLNDDRGADYKDAVIITNGIRRRGDIELHLKTSDWWHHRHHLDPAYNCVVLHVVYRSDTARPVNLENGFSVPSLALQDYLETAVPETGVMYPCRQKKTGNLKEALEKAGDTRFFTAAECFRDMSRQKGAGQTLYQGIMTALGYTKNKQPMAELAARLPLRRLEALAVKNLPDDEYLAGCQGLLLGAAGLLPLLTKEKIPEDAWLKKLGYYWQSSRPGIITDSRWNFFKVRPGNHPVRRLAAMSHLLYRYKDRGLLDGLQGVFNDAPEANGSLPDLHEIDVSEMLLRQPLAEGSHDGGLVPGDGAEQAAPLRSGPQERTGQAVGMMNVLGHCQTPGAETSLVPGMLWIAFDLNQSTLFNVGKHTTTAMTTRPGRPCCCTDNLAASVIHRLVSLKIN